MHTIYNAYRQNEAIYIQQTKKPGSCTYRVFCASCRYIIYLATCKYNRLLYLLRQRQKTKQSNPTASPPFRSVGFRQHNYYSIVHHKQPLFLGAISIIQFLGVLILLHHSQYTLLRQNQFLFGSCVLVFPMFLHICCNVQLPYMLQG